MTKLISLAAAAAALGLAVWAIVAASAADTTMAFASSAYRDALRPQFAAVTADRLEGAARAAANDRQAAEDAAERAPLPAAALPPPRLSTASSDRSDPAEEAPPPGLLPSVVTPSPPRLPPANSTTLGYTLPQSHTASENAVAPR